MPVIGFLGSESPDRWANFVSGFKHGLSETGYFEGRNVAIEYRWAEGQNDRVPALVADLVGRQVTVIAVPGSTPAALAAKAATTKIPIVFLTAVDPVQVGLVASLNRPGGNVTGLTTINLEIAPKRLELLHQVIPAATVIALLVNPTNPTLAERLSSDAQAAARALGVKLQLLHASDERQFDPALASLARMGVVGLVIGTDIFFNSRMEQLAALTLRHALPAIYHNERRTVALLPCLHNGAMKRISVVAVVYSPDQPAICRKSSSDIFGKRETCRPIYADLVVIIEIDKTPEFLMSCDRSSF